MCQSVWAAVTNDRRMTFKQHLFLRVLEAGKSGFRKPGESRSGKAWFLVFVLPAVSLRGGRARRFSEVLS